ncbi:DUF1488 family protein [Streptomyces sp. Agncl-13]|uniref:DUF1488 family protein n=1 Tax=Streptomyces sp. Agncl-13 TaxID=3400628 RepID=UPI003A86A911
MSKCTSKERNVPEIIGNCVHFRMSYVAHELQCRVSNQALLKMMYFAENDPIVSEVLLKNFSANRAQIERIAIEKFKRGDRWLGGVWVTLHDVTEDLLRAKRHF